MPERVLRDAARLLEKNVHWRIQNSDLDQVVGHKFVRIYILLEHE